MAKTTKPKAASTATEAKKVATESAKSIAGAIGVKKLYENSKGEYFTELNLAMLSDKKDNIKLHDFTAEEEVVSQVKTEKRTVTALDLQANPELVEEGVKVGDVVEIPV